MKRTILIITLILSLFGSIYAGNSLLRLKMDEFSTEFGTPDYSALNLQRNEMVAEYDYFIVQFNGRINQADRNMLEGYGAKIYDYVPENALIVQMTENVLNNVKQKNQIQYIDILQPAFRIDPDIINRNHVLLDNEENMKLFVILLDNDHIASFIEKLNNRNIDFENEDRFFRIITDEYNFRDIAIDIANMPEVFWVERDYPAVLHNTWSRWINDTYMTDNMQATIGRWYAQMSLASAEDSLRLALYAHGLYGEGQIVGVDDTGLDWDNEYFRDPSQSIYYDKDKDLVCESPNYNHRKVVAYNAYIDTFDNNISGHGTHTSGSVAGDSLNSNIPSATSLARGMGMAPLAQLAFFDLENSSGNFLTPVNLELIYLWAYDAGARITSSSWGTGPGGSSSYTSRSQQLDQIAWDNKDLLMFRSAGNSNTPDGSGNIDSVNAPATAKNIVTVGANESGGGTSSSWSNPGSSSNNDPVDVAEFSSHGPTKEGMRKPELIASGGWYIWSADSDGDLSTDNGGITYMGGTSMSCPTAAGFAAIVREYFMKGFYPTGAETPSDSFTPSAALVKATLINSTRNAGGFYSTDQLNHAGMQNAPSMGQGWGRITVSDALYFSGETRDMEIHDISPGFSTDGQYDEYTIKTGPDMGEYIKIVLVYTDYPGTVIANSVLVNDLDLTVIAGANTYVGNVFGTETRSVTGGDYDSDNNTEVVWLDSLPNSIITVRVEAAEINNGPQPYALVITGDLGTMVSGPMINYYKHEVYDTLTTGTVLSDGEINNGETADINVWVYNSTGSAYADVTAELSTSSPYCTFINSTLNYGSVQNADSAADIARLYLSRSTPNNTYIPITMITTYNSGSNIDTSYFNIKSAATSVVNIDRDSLVFEVGVAGTKSANSDNITFIDNPEPVYITEKAVLTPEIIRMEPAYDTKGSDYDTLLHDDNTVASLWSGVDYWAVGFTPTKPCSVSAVQWARLHGSVMYDTIRIHSDNGNEPGTELYKGSFRVRNLNLLQMYRSVLSSSPYVNDRFWVSIFAQTYSSTGTDSSYVLGDASGGTNSMFSGDGSAWMSLITYDSDLIIRAEVTYVSSIVDSGMFYVVNNDSASVKPVNVDTVTVKNGSLWISYVNPVNGQIDMGDSLAFDVFIDNTSLIPDTTYTDTLLIYTDADFTKDAVLQLPVILHTTNATGIDDYKSSNDIVKATYFSIEKPVFRNKTNIEFSLLNASEVNAAVYDVSGRQVNELINAYFEKGVYQMTWNGTDRKGRKLAAGVYFIKVSADNKIINSKVIIVK